MSTRATRRSSGINSGSASKQQQHSADAAAAEANVTLSPPAAAASSSARPTRRSSVAAASSVSPSPSPPAASAARRSSSMRAAEALATINAEANKQEEESKEESSNAQISSAHIPAAAASSVRPRRRLHKPADAAPLSPSPPPPAVAAAAAEPSSPAVAAAAAASSSSSASRRPSRQAAAVKRRGYAEIDSESDEENAAPRPAATAASAVASASKSRGARKQQSKNQPAEERKESDSAMEDEEPAAAENDEDEDDEAEAHEASSVDDDASASEEEDDDASAHPSEDDDEFTLTPVEKKKQKRKKASSSSSKSDRKSGSKKAAGKKGGAATTASSSETAATAAAASSSSKKKPTAAQRKRSLIVLSPDTPEEKTMTPSQEESDRRFREFAAAIDPPKRSSAASKRNSSSAAAKPKPIAAAVALSDDDDDIMEIEPFVPSAHKHSRNSAGGAAGSATSAAAAAAASSSSTPSAAAAWSSLGLRPVDNKLLAAAAAASKGGAKGGKNKASASASKLSSSSSSASSGPQLLQSERDSRLNQLCSMLGDAALSSRSTVLKYLEAAGWSVDTAVCAIMDSTWFKSSHSGEDQPATAANAAASGSAGAAASSAHDAIDISDDESSIPAAAGGSSSATPKRKLSGSSPNNNKKSRSSGGAAAGNSTLDAFAGLKSEPSDDFDDAAPRYTAPPPVAPSWDRKLLCLLNVRAQSLTHGNGIMVAGDELQFRRESFDLEEWGERQLRENEAADAQRKADANANATALAATSSSTGAAAKKKPALSRPKSKPALAAAALKKRASRVLRFAKKGASASHLEIGSVPALLTELLAPLFDSGCIDLESQVSEAPFKLEPFDTVKISLSIFVLPALFMWRPPSATLEALEKQAANPFFRAIYAKKNANAHLVWNPVEALAKLLKACGLQPIASVEAELDEQAAKAKEADAAMATAMPATATNAGGASDFVAAEDPDVSMNGEQPAAASLSSEAAAAASSSSAAAASAAAAPSADDPAGVDEADAGPNNEGASVSRFQLDALYAGATASCAVIPEADAPAELRTTLKAYQRQALHWMMARESNRVDAAANTQLDSTLAAAAAGSSPSDRRARPRHPLFEEYTFADEPLNTPFWINPFSNEITLTFPESTGSCLGGALCDEMGLGKTVMSIALILAHHPSKLLLDPSENEEVKTEPAATVAASAAASVQEERNNMDDEDEEVQAMDAPASSSSAAAAAPAAASSSSSFFDSVHSSRSRHRRSYMFHKGVTGATLVVCPMSLLSQWRDEIARFSNLDTLIYHGGSKQDRMRVDFTSYDVVLTSYGVVASEHRAVVAAQTAASAAATAASAAGQKSAPATLSARHLASLSPLFSTNWWRICLDEAHTVRNRSTEQAKAVFQLRGVRRWVITGTLIQNKLDDAFAALKFLGEEPWCSWGWWHAVISAPFEKQDALALQRLRAILTPLMLRRTKAMRTASGESIVELPPRVDETLVCDFSPDEQAFYTAIYTRSKAQFEGFVASGAVMNKYIQVLTLLLRLRQCCDHMFLILGRTRSDDEFQSDIDNFLQRFASRIDMAGPNAPTVNFLTNLAGDLKKTGTERSECPICLDTPSIPVLTECGHLSCRECLSPLFNERGFARCPVCRAIVSREKLFLVPAQDSGEDGIKRIDPVGDWVDSCKTARLLAELKSIRLSADPSAKSIIFSQWTTMLDLIEIPLNKEGFIFLRLDGTLTQKERTEVLRQFASSTSAATILLISLRAGGQGLNLVSANHVFLFDCWWNPSVEEQAIQRVHRIGQTKTSYVRRFVVRGSVEERILELQKRKSHLAQAVSMTTEEQKSMKMNDLVDLFRNT